MTLQNDVDFIKETENIVVTRQTIDGILKKASYICRARQKNVVVKKSTLKKRKIFYEKYKKFNFQNFQIFIFSDESTFCLRGSIEQKTFFLPNRSLPSKKKLYKDFKIWLWIFNGLGLNYLKGCR